MTHFKPQQLKNYLLLFTSLIGAGTFAQIPVKNFETFKSKCKPSHKTEGVLIGFYDGSQYSTQLFKLNPNGKVEEGRSQKFLASPQPEGFQFFQEQKLHFIEYHDTDNVDEDFNYSCYRIVQTNLVVGDSPKNLYSQMYQNEIDQLKSNLASLKIFDGEIGQDLESAFLYNTSREEIKWAVPGYIQIIERTDSYDGGAHGNYHYANNIQSFNQYPPSNLTNGLFAMNDEDKNWKNIKLKAYRKALKREMNVEGFSIDLNDLELKRDYNPDTVAFETITPDFPIDYYEEVDYQFLHRNGELHLGVTFFASAPYVISHTYELSGTIDAGPIKESSIGYRGQELSLKNPELLCQLSPEDNYVVVCENSGDQTLVKFFDSESNEIIKQYKIKGKSVMMEWCSDKYLEAWSKAIDASRYSKIIDNDYDTW